MKRFFKLFFTIIFSSIFIFISLSFIYPKSPFFNIFFWDRVINFPRSKPYTSLNWSGYHPREIVKGKKQELKYSKKDEIKISSETIKKISDYVEERNSTALLILQKNQIVYEKYFGIGGENIKSDSASMAKTVLALLIGIAIDEKKILSEDELASKYIIEWQNDERKNITIKNLLQMTSGLYNYDSTSSPFSDLAKMHGGFYLEDTILNVKQENKEGIKNNYNNVNSQILELVLERATKKRYADYLAEKIWIPLGANDANLWLDHENGMPRAYCCLFATPKDWAKIGLLLLNDGFYNGKQIIPIDWLKKMTTPSPLLDNYGYQIWLAHSKAFSKNRLTEDFSDENMIFLDGRGRQRVYIIKSKDLVVVRIGESPKDWDESFIPNNLIKDLEKK